MNARFARAAVCTALLAAILSISGCGSSRQRLDIVAAASLREALEDLAASFEAANPGIEVRLQSGGSSALARRVVDLGLDADLVALADPALFEEVLEPGWSRTHVSFATDRIVLAYTSASRGADTLASAGWAAVLRRQDVAVAMADPDLAPVGYRALLALRLYDLDHPGAGLESLVRGKVGRRYLRPDVADLLAPLEAGAVDYAFVYSSTASAAHLPHVELPPEMNLGDPLRVDAYARVSIEVAGRAPGERVVRQGGLIAYAAATRTGAPQTARRFLQLLLSPQGQGALRRAGLTPLLAEAEAPGRSLSASSARWRSAPVPVGAAQIEPGASARLRER